MAEGVGFGRVLEVFQFPLLRNYQPTTRGEQPHNQRTPIESGISARLSSTSDCAPNTNQLLTNYSFITHSLALSLARSLSLSTHCQRRHCVRLLDTFPKKNLQALWPFSPEEHGLVCRTARADELE
jgi:hypothetical protein